MIFLLNQFSIVADEFDDLKQLRLILNIFFFNERCFWTYNRNWRCFCL